MSDIQIMQVVFDEGGMMIAYQDLDDVRVEGAVIMQKTVRLDRGHPDYAQDFEKVHDRLVRVLTNALEDWESSEPYRPEVDDVDEDDDRGMGE